MSPELEPKIEEERYSERAKTRLAGERGREGAGGGGEEEGERIELEKGGRKGDLSFQIRTLRASQGYQGALGYGPQGKPSNGGAEDYRNSGFRTTETVTHPAGQARAATGRSQNQCALSRQREVYGLPRHTAPCPHNELLSTTGRGSAGPPWSHNLMGRTRGQSASSCSVEVGGEHIMDIMHDV